MATETSERPAIFDGALHGCLEDLLVLETLKGAIEQARAENARDHRPPRIDDRLVNKTERLRQLQIEFGRVLRIADLSAAQWADLDEFVERGWDAASRRRAFLESMTQAAVDALSGVGVKVSSYFREDWQISDEERTVARLACTIVQFYKNCTPSEQRKLAARAATLGYPDAGVGLYMDEHGERHADAYNGMHYRAA